MKYLGFLKMFDENHPASENEISDLRKGSNVPTHLRCEILSYLKSGRIIWSWMTYWFDHDGTRN